MGAVHLTFDNGPHPVVTPRVLDVLAEHGVTATFFVLGKELERPGGLELARRIRDAGHRLGNHSWSHETPLGDDPRPDAVDREMEATQRLLDRVWDGPVWFRPFGGGGVLGPHLLSPAAVDWMAARQTTCVLWNAVPGDWLDADRWVEKAHTQLAENDVSVLVLHDILPEAMAHLDRFLTDAKAAGHSFSDPLPDDCVPLRDGVAGPGLAACVRA